MKRSFFPVLATIAVLFWGCKRHEVPSGQGNSAQTELLIYCGAGLRPVSDELIDAFKRKYNIKIVADYAGSEVLLSKIRLVPKGDLYMPGDKHYVDQAARENLVLSQKSVCYWLPVIFVKKGNPKQIHTLRDLLGPGIKIGLGDPQACAIGRTTSQLLEKNNIQWSDIEKNISFQSMTVNELGLQIQAGALDAVIVWDAVAKYYSQYGDQIKIPPESNVTSNVDMAVLKSTNHEEMANNFVQFALSQEGRDIFEKHDYHTQPMK